MKKGRKSKKVYNYTAVFEPDKEAGGFSVSIPELPGCISEGDNFEEAQRNIEEAASLYLETVGCRSNFMSAPSGFVVASIRLEV